MDSAVLIYLLVIIFLILPPEQISQTDRRCILKNIVVFASGSGTNFQAIIDAVEAGKINARIRGLIASKPGIKAIERAKNHQIDTKILSFSDYKEESGYEEELLRTLDKWEPDLIVLAGYMLKIPDPVIEQYRNRMINIHPALLPKYGGKGFYGLMVHKAVIADNEKESGCSVHYVTEKYDDGPVIAQAKVPVYESDDAETLAQRVLKEEHKLLPTVIAELISGY